MPLNKLNGQYKTVGCFCMPECVVAYIFGEGGRFGSPDRMYSLLHEVVLERDRGRAPPIKRAASRETLDIFGGPYDIAAFRKLSGDYQRDMRTYVPPLRPVALAFEETSVSYDGAALTDSNRVTTRAPPQALSNSERVAKAAKQLRLRRAKRSTSENTLESFMNLRIKESRRDPEEEGGGGGGGGGDGGGGGGGGGGVGPAAAAPPIRVC